MLIKKLVILKESQDVFVSRYSLQQNMMAQKLANDMGSRNLQNTQPIISFK